MARALDYLTQRFQALEVAIEQPGWTQARWLELLPATDTGLWSQEDLPRAEGLSTPINQRPLFTFTVCCDRLRG